MEIRKAKITDMEEVHGLISYYAEKGLMLARPRSMLYEGVREFTVAAEEGRVIGAGSLHIIWDDLAEVRALAVHPDYQKKRIGSQLVDYFIKEARELHLPKLFTLTYQPGFFTKCGFRVVAKEELPHKVWKECINCPKFPYCDETAMIMDL